MKPARYYPPRAALSPRDKVRADRDLATRNAAMRALNRIARAEHRAMLAKMKETP